MAAAATSLERCLAEQRLGEDDRWKELFDLNRELIDDPDLIFPGQVLVLPTGGC